MEVVGRLLALLVLLLVGTWLRTNGVLDRTRAAKLNDTAYYVALPALIFISTYDQAVGELLSPALLVGLLFVLFSTAGLAWLVHRNRSSRPRQSVAIVQSYHSNLGYLGFPLVAATFGEEVTAIAGVILGIISLIQLPLTVLILVFVNEADTKISQELKGLFKNPVLIALLAGLAIGSSSSVTVPALVAGGLDIVGAFALPLALLCVGASLQVDLPAVDFGASGSVIALKIICMPLLAWIVFSLLTVDDATFTASVVMLGTPTAVSTFVFANELGGDEEFASLNVFATTLVSIGTLFVLITLVN